MSFIVGDELNYQSLQKVFGRFKRQIMILGMLDFFSPSPPPAGRIPVFGFNCINHSSFMFDIRTNHLFSTDQLYIVVLLVLYIRLVLGVRFMYRTGIT